MIERRLAAAMVLLPVAGCSFLLDFSELPDAGLDSDAPDPCGVFEPNDDRDAATAPPSYPISAAICVASPPDIDFYSFAADGVSDVTVQLTMTDGTGPRSLALRLYDDGGTELDLSDTEANIELIERTSALENTLTAGTYTVEVFGSAPDNTNTYSLTVELQ